MVSEIMVKIHQAAIEILSFLCSALFLVTAAILESQTAKKKYNEFIQETFCTKTDQFQPMVLRILSFSCLCYFLVTVPGGHLG